eukprot:310922_1
MAVDTKHDEADQFQQTSSYTLAVSVIRNKLVLHLHDTKTKYMYQGSFTSDDLGKCGFNDNQRSNVENVCKFIEAVKSGYHNWKFAMSVEQNQNSELHANVNVGARVGLIKLSKTDDFFPINIVMRLTQMDRKKIDILADHIKDLRQEIIALKNDNKQLHKHVMPKGAIIMWSGAINNIPNEWALCDGTNNTPDLAGKFILGGNNDEYKIGDNGGSKVHQHTVNIGDTTLTIDQIPSHSHKYRKHHGNSKQSSNYTTWQSCTLQYNIETMETHKTGGSEPHSHSVRCGNANNMPPYIVLGYIMKIA